MKVKFIQNFVIGLLVVGILGLAAWLFFYVTNSFVLIPKTVQDKYVEVASKYQESLGSSVMKCDSDKGEIFLVSGSGGYTGITYYFDLDGKSLGSFEFSDVVFGNEPTPPVQVAYDTCDIIKSNTGLKNKK